MERRSEHPERLLPADDGRQQASGLPRDMLELYEELQPRLRQQVRRQLEPSCDSVDVEYILQSAWDKAVEAWTSSPLDHRTGQRVRHTLARAISEALSQLQSRNVPGTPPHAQTQADRLRRLPPARRLEVAVCWVVEATAQVLGHCQVETMDAERTFRDLGLVTTDLRHLREQLTQITGLPLEPSSTSPSSTPKSVACLLLARLTPAEDDLPEPTDQFEDLYRGFHPRLRRYASHILGSGYSNDVDDVMQTVWIAVLGNWCRIRQMEYVEAYLFKVTRNESLRIRHATIRRYSCSSPTEDVRLLQFAEHKMRLQPDEIDQVLQKEWLRRCIAEEIAPHLSPQQLAILLLAAAGHGNERIAEALGVAPGTIRVQRHRLRRKLQAVLPQAFWSNG
ncbi:sigma-70 family RNA polymerase sigma factor [Streptomyces longwoodensis]|uniref:sigma-70 family RNA polymerase sigma factor n=1 Tax=Streptomyces longwoodensis TaxID=68231 RepID=UPI00225BC02B|nr:sigma-70 family RNA polymerase sigma factor [Streptomyces longwoodensis]MCX5000824.1 sigma-70 family RNA polymerase sigma factor [Streptomyces longwoodensis]